MNKQEKGLGQRDGASQDLEQRVRDIVSRMSLEEKVGEMSANTPLLAHLVMIPRYNKWPYRSGGNRRLGVPRLKFSDGPRGVVMGNSTCFPVSMARGATFDPELEERVGSVMGYEARAQGANFFGGVCINLLRHPGWGRAQETFGEDPHHLGVMGTAMIRGVQKHMMACAKHYAMNSIEQSRFFVDVRADERTLREVYLPHFKKCVDEGVASIMSAYNRVNGEWCGHNGPLLRGILKGEWGFEGFVISDFFWGVRDTVAAAKGGLDIEMPIARFYGKKLIKAVHEARAPARWIEEAVTRIVRQKLRFEKAGEPGGYDRNRIACQDHAQLALEAARKSIVLLKNDGPLLPLDLSGLKSIAVIGRLADKVNLGDMGSSRVRPPYAVTPLAGIKRAAGDGVEVVYQSGKNLGAAKRAAARADAVVMVAGLTSKQEGEYLPVIEMGGDRTDLRLPGGQEELIKEIAGENKNCIVVLEGGSAIIMEAWKGKVPAIMMIWYPGMEGGTALADVIFGKVNPSGKLPVTFPASTDQLPPFDTKAKKVEYGYFHGYRLMDKQGCESAFPFGFGLCYTGYEYSNLRVESNEVAKDGSIEVSVDVTNTGEMAGEEVAQLYVGCKGSAVERAVKELKGFRRVLLQPGETKTVTFTLPVSELAYYSLEKKSWVVEPIEYQVRAGSSSADKDLLPEETFRVREG